MILDNDLAASLESWILENYRDRLKESADLRDPALLDESHRALDELTRLLELSSVYPFQLNGAPA